VGSKLGGCGRESNNARFTCSNGARGFWRMIDDDRVAMPTRLPLPYRCKMQHSVYIHIYDEQPGDYRQARRRRLVQGRPEGFSHVQFKHPTKPGRVTVPYANRDIPLGTLRSIEKQAGLKLR
jgi:hypothetical protein